MKWASKVIKNGLCHYDCHYHWFIIQIEGSILLSRCPFTVESWAPPSEEMGLGNLRKRREFDKTKRTKENPSFSRSSFSLCTIPSLLLLYFLDLLLFSFHFLILQFLFLHSTAVPILSGIELHWNVLWCSWGFSHRWHSAKIEHRPILSPLSRLSSYVPSPPSSSSPPLSSSS